MHPDVTIIIPVFNTAKYLNECIKSLMLIKFSSIEVIFIDNNSTDGSFEILKKIKKKGFRIIKNKKNYGQSYSLNKAIKISKSKFIAIMDSDDICLPNRIVESFNFLKQNPKYVMVAGKSDTIDNKGKILKRRRFTYDEDLIETRMLIENPISHTTVMIRKSIFRKIGKYSLKLKYTQDYDLFSRILNKNLKIKILEKKLTKVRKHRGQQSFKNQGEQLNERFYVSLNNLNKKIKINSDILSLIKFIIFGKNQKFLRLNIFDKMSVIDEFLNKTFKNNLMKLYFCSLIFSRANDFEKGLRLKILIKYIMKNRFLIFRGEVILRVFKSFLRIVF